VIDADALPADPVTVVGAPGAVAANAGDAGMTREATVKATESTNSRGEGHVRPRQNKLPRVAVKPTSNLDNNHRGRIIRQIGRINPAGEHKFYRLVTGFKTKVPVLKRAPYLVFS
jgi:hypothetical protein